MVRCSLVLLIIGLCLTQSPAQERYLDPLFEEINQSTYTYAQKENEDLQLDVYMPENDTEKMRPLLLYVHGGGFSGGQRDSQGIVDFGRAMASQGYVVASISYSLIMKGVGFGCAVPAHEKKKAFISSAQDIARATIFLTKKKDELGIDPQEIVLLGSSAGAEAILHAAYWPEAIKEGGQPLLLSGFRYAGLISMAGALVTLDWVTEDSAIPSQFFHGTCDNLVPYGAAPHHYCDPAHPGYMPLFGGQSISEKLRALGKPFYLYTACGGRHEWAGKPMGGNRSEITDFLYHDVLMGEKRQINQVVDTGQEPCPDHYPEFNFCE